MAALYTLRWGVGWGVGWIASRECAHDQNLTSPLQKNLSKLKKQGYKHSYVFNISFLSLHLFRPLSPSHLTNVYSIASQTQFGKAPPSSRLLTDINVRSWVLRVLSLCVWCSGGPSSGRCGCCCLRPRSPWEGGCCPLLPWRPVCESSCPARPGRQSNPASALGKNRNKNRVISCSVCGASVGQPGSQLTDFHSEAGTVEGR